MNMNKRILVVENEIVIADEICLILHNLGYQPLEPALNYNEAIRLFHQERPDLIILDVKLNTKKSGIDVANYIRSKSDTPFIYLTSYTDPGTLELAKATMPYAYLVKPFEREDILAAVEVAFNNYQWLKPGKEEVRDVEEMHEFTPMEKVILRKIAENVTTRQIAGQLHVSESTIKNHRHNICVKLQLPATTHSLLNLVLRNTESLIF
jgi:DNA-binding NarL/FixJ family response regulator